jgi:hypothetical protein
MIASLTTLATEAQYPNYPEEDNITLSKADFKAIANLIQQREMLSRNIRKYLIIKINGCTTIKELNSINLDFVSVDVTDLDG